MVLEDTNIFVVLVLNPVDSSTQGRKRKRSVSVDSGEGSASDSDSSHSEGEKEEDEEKEDEEEEEGKDGTDQFVFLHQKLFSQRLNNKE